MNCEKVQESFSAYFEGELSVTTVQTVEAHFTSCGRCKSEYQEFVSVWTMLGEVADAPIPDNLGHYVSARLNTELLSRQYARPFDWLRVLRNWGLGGAVATVAIVGYLNYGSSRGPIAGPFEPKAAPVRPFVGVELSIQNDTARFTLSANVPARVAVTAQAVGAEETRKEYKPAPGKAQQVEIAIAVPTTVSIDPVSMADQPEYHFFLPAGEPTLGQVFTGDAKTVLQKTAVRYGMPIEWIGPLTGGTVQIDTNVETIEGALQATFPRVSVKVLEGRLVVRVQ